VTLGSSSISGGVATYTTSSLAIGTYAITASYGGDTTNSTATSNTLTQKVTRILFTDNFDSGPNSLWLNKLGGWSASGGVYDAAAGSVFPMANSLLPFSLTNFSLHVETTKVGGDGGVFFGAFDSQAGNTKVDGLLLVIRPRFGDIYFNPIVNGSVGSRIVSTSLSAAPHSFDVSVTGGNYVVLVDGVQIFNFNDSNFSTGQVGVYDSGNGALGFENFIIYDTTLPRLAASAPRVERLAVARV